MESFISRLRIFQYLVVGIALALLGLLALNHIVNNIWAIDTTNIELIRSVVRGQAETAALLRASNLEILLAFLATLFVTITGVILPVSYLINRRFGQPRNFHYLVVLRQAMWVGMWAAFCTWLQINRSLNIGLALLVAVVFIVTEIMLQVRTRAEEAAA